MQIVTSHAALRPHRPAHWSWVVPAVCLVLLAGSQLLPPTVLAASPAGAELRTADPGGPASRPTADDDQDGISNADEALLGSDPTKKDSDNDGQTDWQEALNMTNPNRATNEGPRLFDRFRFNTSDGRSDRGLMPQAPIPGAGQWVESFEEKAWHFPATGSRPLIYSLAKRPFDLGHGMVRFWYVPETPRDSPDRTPRTLIHAYGTRDNTHFEWRLELLPEQRQICFSSSVESGEVRTNVLANLPAAQAPLGEAVEICLSFTAGSSWISVNGQLLDSKIAVVPGRPMGLGVDAAGIKRLLDCGDRRIAYGGRITGPTSDDQPALGLIDFVEWFNTAMGQPFPFYRASTPWGATRESSDLRRFSGFATPAPKGDGIQINLRRGWEGPLTGTPDDADPYRLQRREWGVTGPDAWQTLRQGTRANLIVDRGVTAGKWYEYRLPEGSPNRGPSIWGYAGARPPLSAGPGYAIVVGVERTLLSWEAEGGPLHAALQAYLAGLKKIYGASRIVEIDSLRRMGDDPNLDGQLEPREGPVPIFDAQTPENTEYQKDLIANKEEIMDAFRRIEGPANRIQLLVLIGHVTVPLAGAGAEDGHLAPIQVAPGVWQPAHAGAWACDAWYGDFDGRWTDTAQISPGASGYINGTPRTDWQARNVPGDGKFDQNALPPNAAGEIALEAAVGRIDFSKMPGFRNASELTAGETGFRNAELRLTAAYLNKATAYRNGNGPKPDVEGVRTQFGSPVPPAMPTMHQFVSLARPAMVASTRQYDGTLPDSAGEDLFDTGPLALWGFHGGYGSYAAVQGAAGQWRNTAEIAQWENASFLERSRQPEHWGHSLITIVCGSFFGDWNHEPEDLFFLAGTPTDPIRMGAGNLQKSILAESRAGLATFVQFPGKRSERFIVFNRAAAGFPLGVALLDTVAYLPDYPLHGLYLLGDPTLITK